MKKQANFFMVYAFITAWVAGVFFLMSFSRHEIVFRWISFGLELFVVVLVLRAIFLKGRSKP